MCYCDLQKPLNFVFRMKTISFAAFWTLWITYFIFLSLPLSIYLACSSFNHFLQLESILPGFHGNINCHMLYHNKEVVYETLPLLQIWKTGDKMYTFFCREDRTYRYNLLITFTSRIFFSLGLTDIQTWKYLLI